MPDDSEASGNSVSSSEDISSDPATASDISESTERPTQPAEEILDEADLLGQARDFLLSPAIRHQDMSSKREFLLKKGVSSADAERLLEETDVRPIQLSRSVCLCAWTDFDPHHLVDASTCASKKLSSSSSSFPAPSSAPIHGAHYRSSQCCIWGSIMDLPSEYC